MDSAPGCDTAETPASGIGTEASPTGQGDETLPSGDGVDSAPNGSTEEPVRALVGAINPTMLELHASLLSGEELGSFFVVADAAVRDLKRQLLQLPALQGTAARSLRLVFGGQALEDRQRLCVAGVPNGARLQAVRCPSHRAEAVLRCRPPQPGWPPGGERPVLSLDASRNSAVLALEGEAERLREFELDRVFGAEGTQEEFFSGSGARSIVEDVVRGRSGLIICFGQTFSGKRHTAFGDRRWLQGLLADRSLRAPAWEGLLPRSFDCIAGCIAALSDATVVVSASFLEVVQEAVYDLLDGVDGPLRQCQVRLARSGVTYAEGLTSREIHSADDLRAAFADGWARHVGWVMHMGGSSAAGSHMLFTVKVDVHEVGSDGSRCRRSATLRLAKLAGSERLPRSFQTLGLREPSARRQACAAFINVVRSLARNADHSRRPTLVPWRDSNITRLLKDGLDGGSRTLMVATCCASEGCWEETYIALRMAQDIRKVTGELRAHEDLALELSALELEALERLRWDAPAAAGGGREGGGPLAPGA